jgi:hypothetical protein
MKKALAILLAVVSLSAAGKEDWANPEAPFNARTLNTEKSAITWLRVDKNKVQATCEAESKNRKLGGFGYTVYACSFWEINTCTIITSNTPTLHDLGHEMRHCFQGSFH